MVEELDKGDWSSSSSSSWEVIVVEKGLSVVTFEDLFVKTKSGSLCDWGRPPHRHDHRRPPRPDPDLKRLSKAVVLHRRPPRGSSQKEDRKKRKTGNLAIENVTERGC